MPTSGFKELNKFKGRGQLVVLAMNTVFHIKREYNPQEEILS